MNRSALLRRLRKYGCYLKREGRSHSLWINPNTGTIETIPRHTEPADHLANRICSHLGVPKPE